MRFWFFFLLLLAAFTNGATLLSDDFSTYGDNSTASPPWRLAWQGYAHYAVENETYKLWTVPPTDQEGHSALAIIGDENWSDYVFEVDVKTQSQQRQVNPEPWEVAWVFFRYNGQYNWYYFVLKTNGYELGKNPGCLNCQDFLVTETSKKLTLGEWNHLKIELNGSRIKVHLNDEQIIDYLDVRSPVYQPGGIALYEENSIAYFDNVKVYNLGEGTPAPPFLIQTPEATSNGARNSSYGLPSAPNDSTARPAQGAVLPPDAFTMLRGASNEFLFLVAALVLLFLGFTLLKPEELKRNNA